MSQWSKILTPAEIDAYHALIARLDAAFATGDRKWWMSRTADELRAEAAASWNANTPTTYQLARSYLAMNYRQGLTP
jgi:hypothetical protein